MEVWTGNIWKLVTREDAIVIPTNIGWRNDGTNVMGRGLARDAHRRWPGLAAAYGQACKISRSQTGIIAWEAPRDFPAKAVILFPTKPLFESKPYMSWQNKSSYQLIEKSAEEMNIMAVTWPVRHVLVPIVGCGNGSLDARAIIPLLHKKIVDPKCVLVMRQNDVPVPLAE